MFFIFVTGKIKSIEPLKDGDVKITLEYTSKRKKWLFFGAEIIKKRVISYIGSCTVWRVLPSHKRAGTFMESELSNIWHKWKYEKENG